MLRIDAHHHLWQLNHTDGPWDYRWLDAPALAPIRRDFLPHDLRPLLAETGVDKSVIVQTQHHLAENDWALSLAEQHDFLAGVVGWIDLTANDCAEQLDRYRHHPKFCGVRHVTQDEPDDDFIVRSDVIRGLKTLQKHGIPFDLLFYDKHLHHAPALARSLPELPMVIDHLSKPRIRERALDPWRNQIRQAAAFPNIHCKLSGMATEADWKRWSAADLKPYVETVVDAFGPERCMYGSDWPVCLLAGSYRQVHDALAECLAELSASEQERIFGGTAVEFYKLSQ